MDETPAGFFQKYLPDSKPNDPERVPQIVEAILTAARDANASDVHLRPTADKLEMLWRLDGVLQPVAVFPRELGPQIVARLKVLAELLTYRCDMPQEGRIRSASSASQIIPGEQDVETRLSTFPTLFGEKAVLRLFVGSGKYRRLSELGLHEDVLPKLKSLLEETSGVILLTGPAGSGKTTTIYACLREIDQQAGGGRSLVSLEDPIEVVVPGVDQSQVHPSSGFDMAVGLKSLLRQDPDVLMVGEIRDADTAETVFQASLTGHLVLTTFHAGSSAQAVSRLGDMGIEPYLLHSGLSGDCLPATIAAVVRLCPRIGRTPRPAGPAFGERAGSRGLPELPRHGLSRAVCDRRVAVASNWRNRRGNFSKRQCPQVGGTRDRSGHDQPMGPRPERCPNRPNQPAGTPPRAGRGQR